MPCIYLTINHWNKHYGINPYLYIGSNQNDNPKYFGSNKLIKEDIKILGSEFFEKIILESFLEINNCDLRNKERIILEEKDCAKDPKFYNRTNNSLPGYRETIEERKIRIENGIKSKIKKKEKLGYIIPKENQYFPLFGEKNWMFGKKYIEVLKNKYGEEVGTKMYNDKQKRSSDRMKKKNPCKKIINEDLSKKMLTLAKEGKKHKEIAEILEVSYWLVVRYCKKKDLKD